MSCLLAHYCVLYSVGSWSLESLYIEFIHKYPDSVCSNRHRWSHISHNTTIQAHHIGRAAQIPPFLTNAPSPLQFVRVTSPEVHVPNKHVHPAFTPHTYLRYLLTDAIGFDAEQSKFTVGRCYCINKRTQLLLHK